MGIASQEAIKQLSTLMDQVNESLKDTYRNIHQGYPTETLVRYLKAREWNVPKAHKMLVDCLNWRMQNEIDNILTKPIIPADLYRTVRDTQLIGLSGYTKEGLPVFAIGVGHSTYDKASVYYYVQSHIQINEYRDRLVLPAATKKHGRYIGTCVKILDMTGLKLSAMSQLKAVRPLLQERTRRKVQVLQGCGRDELLKIMDYASLPHFCRREGYGASQYSSPVPDNCFSLDHPFHEQLYSYIKMHSLTQEFVAPVKQGSFHVNVPKRAQTIESALHSFMNCRRQINIE